MRVNKKRENVSVGVQTTDEEGLVAVNYQQLHAVNARLQSRETATQGETSRGMLQVHVGDNALVVHSSRDVTSKISCGRVLALDTDFVIKPSEFPLSLWSGRQENNPELRVCIHLKEILESSSTIKRAGNESATSVHDRSGTAAREACDGSSNESFESRDRPRNDSSLDESRSDAYVELDELHNTFPEVYDIAQRNCSPTSKPFPDMTMTCDVAVSGLATSLCHKTLNELTLFFEPDPSIASIPVCINCVVTDCGVEIGGGNNSQSQNIDISGIRVKVAQDQSIEIGDVHNDELMRLRSENSALREEIEQLKWGRGDGNL